MHLKAFGLPRFSRAFGQAQGGSGWRRFAFWDTASQAKSVYNCCVYSVKIWKLLYCLIISIFGDYKFMCRFSCEFSSLREVKYLDTIKYVFKKLLLISRVAVPFVVVRVENDF